MPHPQNGGRGCPVCHLSGELCLCGMVGYEQLLAMHSEPVVNYTVVSARRGGGLLLDDYLAGMDEVHTMCSPKKGSRPPEVAKLVLGKQDFCWTDGHRSWVWTRPFILEAADKGSLVWRWRFYASTRGFELEVESRYKRPLDPIVRVAAHAAFHNFMRVWRAGVHELNTRRRS